MIFLCLIKVGTDEATALQGGRAKNALLAVADDETAVCRRLVLPVVGAESGAVLP
ncbi:MAG: hypothetical protein Q7S85_08790 [Rugosibacter sp.]|nr:hypothetical protein [Rugosibacter sp.]